MNRVMRSYTPDLKVAGTTPSRMSTIGTSTTTPIGSATRRRYSVSSVVGAGSVLVTPPARSFSQDAVGTPVNKRMSLHENLMLKILATPVDQALHEQANSSGDESFCSSLGTSYSIEQLLESDGEFGLVVVFFWKFRQVLGLFFQISFAARPQRTGWTFRIIRGWRGCIRICTVRRLRPGSGR